VKPLIGITPSLGDASMPHGTFARYTLARTYTDAVSTAGGVPVILPLDGSPEEVVDRLDGLVLSGGGDIDPTHYGDAAIHPATYGISEERDAFEITVVVAALERDMPVLCICRGIQVLNVALGGTLLQHIPDDVPGEIGHRQQDRGLGRHDLGHTVRLAPGPHLLRSIVNTGTIEVNSFHHQAAGIVGSGLQRVATSDDGVIEALWLPAKRFVLGVQWHPEMIAGTQEDHAALFSAFVEATRPP
jgi:gamma-glutamyl-gamma-aminobutyrate hydrolase PuuD